jgi:hypothetical protein
LHECDVLGQEVTSPPVKGKRKDLVVIAIILTAVVVIASSLLVYNGAFGNTMAV